MNGEESPQGEAGVETLDSPCSRSRPGRHSPTNHSLNTCFLQSQWARHTWVQPLSPQVSNLVLPAPQNPKKAHSSGSPPCPEVCCTHQSWSSPCQTVVGLTGLEPGLLRPHQLP